MEREELHRFGHKQCISNQLTFVKPRYSTKPGIIQNFITGKVIAKDIDWIALPADEDSLIAYSKDDKRGYINRFSGEIAISTKYPKALQHLVVRGKQMIIDKTGWQYWRMQMINFRAHTNIGDIVHTERYYRGRHLHKHRKRKKIDWSRFEGRRLLQELAGVD